MMRIDCVNPWSWYPVIASGDLAAGTLVPISLNGEEFVVWRSRDGVAAVWNNRCPHRGMRLAFGAVAANTLTCAYHGWVFENDGFCSHIPAHPQLKPSAAARVRVYPVKEVHGYVWASVGEPALKEPAPPLREGKRAAAVRTLHVLVEPESALALAMARPLAWWTPADPLPAGWQQSAELQMNRDAVMLSWEAGSQKFTATAWLPGTVNCTLVDGAQRGDYALLMQPTSASSAAIHLAIAEEGGAERKLAFNRACAQMRREAPRLATVGLLARLQALVAQTRAADAIESHAEVVT
jgi:nitrite reductase/ring-hydroxylating ferredoxin subunit